MSGTAPLELPVLASQLAITAEWLLIREMAIEGCRVQIAIEERGMELDRARGRDDQVAERLARMDQISRALQRATAWHPLQEIPRRKP